MITWAHLHRELERVEARMRSVVRRGILTLAASASYFAQVEAFDGEVFDELELWQQFGLASRPPAGGEAALAKVEGRGEGAVIVATTDRAHRPSGLSEGDAALYAQQASGGGQAQVHVKADGDIDLTPGTGQHVGVGGHDELLLLGETTKDDLKSFADALVGMPPTGTAVQNALALEAIRTAATSLSSSTSAWLASRGKVG